MLRIGMSGTGGVGKTTVLNAIMDKYPHLVRPTSSAREVFAELGITEADQRNMKPDHLLELQEKITSHWLIQFTQLYHLESVWDRTMLDHYAYGMVRNHKSVDDTWLFNRESLLIDNLRRYSHFFYFPQPKTWEPKPDPARDPAPGTRKLVDLTMKGYLLNSSTKIHYVPTDSHPEQVVDYVLNILKDTE